MGVGGARMPEGARVVTPAASKAVAQQMRAAMTPSRPSRMRLMPERLGVEFFREAASAPWSGTWPNTADRPPSAHRDRMAVATVPEAVTAQ